MIRVQLKSILPKLFVLFCMTWLLLGASNSKSDAAELLVADIHGNPYSPTPTGRVLAYDPIDGSFIRTVVHTDATGMAGLTLPSSIVIGPKGYLYVANQGTGQILAYDPSKYNTLINDGTIVNGVFASNVLAPGGLLYDSVSNTLFVSEFGSVEAWGDGKTIKQFNANGGLVRTIEVMTDTGGLTGMAMNSNGDLYVSEFVDGKIHKFSGIDNFATAEVFATGAFGAGQLQFDGDDLLVSAQFLAGDTGGIARYDSDGIALPPVIASGLSFNLGLMKDGNGDLLVTEVAADGSEGRIGKFDINTGSVLDSHFISALNTPLDGFPEPFIFPSSMALSPVPEPTTVALTITGLTTLLGLRVYRNRFCRNVH